MKRQEPDQLKVAHIYLDMPVGGAEDTTLLILKYANTSIQHRVICLRDFGALGTELQAAGHPVDLIPIALSKRLNLPGVWKLARVLKAWGTDIVHTQVYNAHVYGGLASRLIGSRHLIHHQKTYSRLRPNRHALMWLLTRWCSGQVVLGRQTITDVCRAYSLPDHHFHIQPNWIDPLVFKPADDRAALRESLGLGHHRILTGTVASLTEPKNHFFTLDVLARLKKQGWQGHHLFIGAGPLESDLQARARALGIENDITFTGAQRPVHPWLQALDLFLLLSTWEGQPLALRQAISCEIPAVVSRIEGNTDTLGASHPGIVDIDEPAATAEIILRCLQDPRFRESLLEHQARSLNQQPDPETWGASWSKIYQTLIRNAESGCAD